jgi:hypothetical protein
MDWACLPNLLVGLACAAGGAALWAGLHWLGFNSVANAAALLGLFGLVGGLYSAFKAHRSGGWAQQLGNWHERENRERLADGLKILRQLREGAEVDDPLSPVAAQARGWQGCDIRIAVEFRSCERAAGGIYQLHGVHPEGYLIIALLSGEDSIYDAEILLSLEPGAVITIAGSISCFSPDSITLNDAIVIDVDE